MEQDMNTWDFVPSGGGMSGIAKLDIGHSGMVEQSSPAFVKMPHFSGIEAAGANK